MNVASPGIPVTAGGADNMIPTKTGVERESWAYNAVYGADGRRFARDRGPA
jgi:hypothetical protein